MHPSQAQAQVPSSWEDDNNMTHAHKHTTVDYAFLTTAIFSIFFFFSFSLSFCLSTLHSYYVHMFQLRTKLIGWWRCERRQRRNGLRGVCTECALNNFSNGSYDGKLFKIVCLLTKWMYTEHIYWHQHRYYHDYTGLFSSSSSSSPSPSISSTLR